MRLQTKIFLFLLPLIVVPISFVGWIAYDRLQSISQEKLRNQMVSSMDSAECQLRNKILSTEDNIVLYVQAEQIANFVLTEDEDQRYSIMLTPLLRLFSSYQSVFKEYIEIRILTRDGYEDARLCTEKIKNTSEYENESEVFKEISKSQKPRYTTFFINPDTSKFNMLVSHKIQIRDNTLSPITDKPSLKGYLMITCSLDFLQDQVDKVTFGKNGALFYTDGKGRVLYHPDEKIRGTKLPGGYFSGLKNIEINGQEFAPLYLEDSLIYAKAKKIHPELYLFATLPAREYNQAGRTQWAMIVLGIIVLSLLIIFGAILTIIHYQILLPIRNLNKAIEDLGRGQLDSKLIVDRKDEIGTLSIKFNSMLEELKKITVSHNYVDAILESMNDSVMVISAKGVIKKTNAGAIEFTGYSRHELLGKFVHELFPEGEEDIFQRIYKGKRVNNFEKNILSKNGRQYPVLFSASSMLYTKDINDIIFVIYDMSDRIKAEQDKINAQKTAAEKSKHALIGQVAGKIAHDFNNVLGIVMAHSELALMDCEDSETKKTLELIFHQTIRGKNLTKNLIAFAKTHEPKQEFFNINEKIDFVVNLLKKDLSEVELVVECNTDGLELLADPGMIEHALVNLIQNSIHATTKVQSPKITIRSNRSGEQVSIEIEDNGCGIPKKHLKEIYEPSFSLKGSKDVTDSYGKNIKGTGYGLANVKKYIDQHQGSVTVWSEPGSGTKFVIRLPIVHKELTQEEKKEFILSNIQFNKSILLVEDETSISKVQYQMLTQEPFVHRVDIAPNGQTALELFDKNTYDLVSLDYVLPGKVNGMDVYHHIRSTNKTIQILFISGNLEFIESIKELKGRDVHMDHLSKPCQNKVYLNRINRLLEKAAEFS